MDRNVTPRNMGRPGRLAATTGKKYVSKSKLNNNKGNLNVTNHTRAGSSSPYHRRQTEPDLNASLSKEERRMSLSSTTRETESILAQKTMHSVNVTSSEAILVGLRIRPTIQYDQSNEQARILVNGSSITVNTGNSSQFDVDSVYDHQTIDPQDVPALMQSQRQIYDGLGAPLLSAFFKGFNCTLFAYGQTGSGKTFSMLGMGDSLPGVIPQFTHNMFDQLPSHTKDTNTTSKVDLAFFEIYQESIFDLLSAGDKCALKLRTHPNQGPFVEGLNWVPVTTATDIRQWINAGQGRRATACTGMNERSSRSHSIVQIKLVITEEHFIDGNKETVTRTSRANLVDLAGSEKYEAATANGESGKRVKEMIGINGSLNALKRVMAELVARASASRRKSQAFIPYRDSVLTHLLSESLGGNSRTALLATISPLKSQIEDSLSTLRFASQARNVVNRATLNQDNSSALIIFDLLSAGDKCALKLRTHPNQGPFVEGLNWVPVTTATDIRQWINAGQGRRATACTGMNERSSRSHSIVQIKLVITEEHFIDGNKETVTRTSRANLVDLAGSEKYEAATANGESGKRVKEMIGINGSLNALKRVMAELVARASASRRKSQAFIPYRDSVLTHLLSESLGGNSRTALLATISPLKSQIEDSLSTLRFASQARNVVNRATLNQDNSSALIARIVELESMVSELKGKGEESQASQREISSLKDSLTLRDRQHSLKEQQYQEKLRTSEQLKTRLLQELGGEFSVEPLAKDPGPFLVTLRVDCSPMVNRVVSPHKLSDTCRILCDTSGRKWWSIVVETEEEEVYLNGMHVNGQTPVTHLDRVVIDKEMYVWWSPEAIHSAVLCDPTIQLLKYSPNVVHSEYLQAWWPRMVHKMEERKQQEMKDYERNVVAELEEMRMEKETLAMQLAQSKKQLHDVNMETYEDGKLHQRKINHLQALISKKEEDLNSSRDSMEVTQEYVGCVKKTIELMVEEARSPMACSTPKENITSMDDIRIASQVSTANNLLAKLGKQIFSFELARSDVDGSLQIHLVDSKHNIYNPLSTDDFNGRLIELERAYEGGSTDESQLIVQRVLYRKSESWMQLDTRRSDVFTQAWQNAMSWTAQARHVSVDKLRKSISSPSSSPSRRSTISSLLSRESMDGSNVFLGQYLQSMLSLDEKMDSHHDIYSVVSQIQTDVNEMTSLHKTPWGQAQIITINRCMTSLLMGTARLPVMIASVSLNSKYGVFCSEMLVRGVGDCDRLSNSISHDKKCWLNALQQSHISWASDIISQIGDCLPKFIEYWTTIRFFNGDVTAPNLQCSELVCRAWCTGLLSAWTDSHDYALSCLSTPLLQSFTAAFGRMLEGTKEILHEFVHSHEFIVGVKALVDNVMNPIALAMLSIAEGSEDMSVLHGGMLEIRDKLDEFTCKINEVSPPNGDVILVLDDTSFIEETRLPSTTTSLWFDRHVKQLQTMLESM